MSLPQSEDARILFADDLVMLTSSAVGLQHAFNGFAAARNIAGMKLSTSKTEVSHLSRNPFQFSLQVRRVSLNQVKKFKYLGVAFTVVVIEGKTKNRMFNQAKQVLKCKFCFIQPL